MILKSFILSCVASNNQFQKLDVFVAMDYGSRSHINFILEASKDLIHKGHRVTYLANDHTLGFGKAFKNINSISIGKSLQNKTAMRESILKMNIDGFDFIKTQNSFGDMFAAVYEDRFNTMLSIFDKNKPDIIVCDSFFVACIDAAQARNIPLIIAASSIDVAPMIASTTYTLEYPYTKPTTTETLSLYEKINLAVFDSILKNYKIRNTVRKLNDIRKRLGVKPKKNVFGDIGDSYVIANSFIGLDTPRPLPPNINFVGPIVSSKITKLDSSLEKYLTTHKRIIYIAFGSVNMLPPQHLKNLIGGLMMAYNQGIIDGLIWGLGVLTHDDFPSSITINNKTVDLEDIKNNRHKDIKLLSWASQIPILQSESTKLFISHGGIDSLYESFLNSVPLLVMPYFADQPKNAYKVKEFGNGDYLEPRKTNSDEIYKKIKYLLVENYESVDLKAKEMRILAEYNIHEGKASKIIESYAYRARICRTGNEEPFEKQPCELKVFMPADTRMPFYKSSLLDAYLAIFLALTISLYTLYRTSRILFKNNLVKLKTN